LFRTACRVICNSIIMFLPLNIKSGGQFDICNMVSPEGSDVESPVPGKILAESE